MLLLSAVPGPSDFAVVARSIASGFRHGVIFTLGIIVADLIFILLAVFGLTAIAENASGWFQFIKYAGGAYLIWLGLSAIRARAKSISGETAFSHSQTSSFLSGFLITLGDPKAILFYFALLPTFIDLVQASMTDIIVIAFAATLAIAIVKLTYAFLGTKARAFFNNPVALRRMNLIAGCILIATGIFLVFKN